ncbi:MAG: tetratricopeptide repeat protein [Paludibacteraceae bacterium]|nr:tetratricopeptide repeat protein [Paludibacteraceae bacterium]
MQHRTNRLLCLLLTTIFIASSYAQVTKMEAEYQQLSDRFEQRDKDVLKDLRTYLKEYPYSTYEDEIHFMIGAIQTERGYYKQALKDLDDADHTLLARPRQPQCVFYRGYCNLMLQEYQKAGVYFAQVSKTTNPYQLKGKYYNAYCQYKLKRYDKALPILLALDSIEEYKQTVPYYLVQIYYAQGNEEEVISRAEYLLTSQPESENNAELHRILGEMYFRQGDYPAAVMHLSTYKDNIPEGIELLRNDLYLLGSAEAKNEDWQAAIRDLKLVKHAADSISESAYMTLGNAYIQTNQLELAKLSYQAAMQLNITPEVREEAMYNYTLTTYRSSTALGESVQAFMDFLKEYPNSKHQDDVFALLSDAFRQSKNYQAALNALDSIPYPNRQLKETKQYLRYQLGTDAFIQGKMEQSIQWMNEVLEGAKQIPNAQLSCEAYYWRAEAEYRLHNNEAAKKDVEQFISYPEARQSANYKMGIYLRGYIYYELHQYTEAERIFNQYTQLVKQSDPTYADVINRLGDCAFNSRSFESAIAYYGQVINLRATGSDYATFQKGYSEGLLHRYDKEIASMRQLVNSYPKSDFADDGLYEMARAELQRENNRAAIEAYEQLLKQYPNSNMARKASIEVAMIYRNMNDYDKAIAAYKQTINKYPSSEEAYSALDGLEAVYVETNNIADYINYTKQLGKLNMSVVTKDDSLSYVAAELQYMLGNYKEAAASLTTYINRYCAGGRYCTTAQYYAADSYYRLGQNDAALSAYTALTNIAGNPYMEEACMRVAQLSYDKEDYAKALDYFYKMLTNASKRENEDAAKLGILRCSYYLNKTKSTIDIASQLINESSTNESVKEEALYNRAKAYITEKQYGNAIADLILLSKDVRTSIGAESKYLLAECYFRLAALEDAEQEIMSFTQMNTQHQYWLAKALILLSDINLQRGDEFQARQYLLTLQTNYKQKDDIQSIVEQRLAALDERSKEIVVEEEEDIE